MEKSEYEEVFFDESDFEEIDLENENVEILEENEKRENEEQDDSVLTFTSHSDAVLCLIVSGNFLISGGCDNLVIVFDLRTGKMIKKLENHVDSVNCLCVSQDGQYFVSGGLDGLIFTWNIQELTTIAKCLGCSEVEWLTFKTNSYVVVAGSNDGTIWLWNSLTGEFLQLFSFHNGRVTNGRFISNENWFVSTGNDGIIVVWDPKTGNPKLKIIDKMSQCNENDPIVCLDISSNSLLSIVGTESGIVKIHHLLSGKSIVVWNECHSASVEFVLFSNPTSGLIASGSLDGVLNIWNSTDFSFRLFCDHPNGIVQGTWHSSLPVIVTACLDNVIRAWDARNALCLYEYFGHSDCILSLKLSGNYIFSSSTDKTIKIFESLI